MTSKAESCAVFNEDEETKDVVKIQIETRVRRSNLCPDKNIEELVHQSPKSLSYPFNFKRLNKSLIRLFIRQENRIA